MTVRGSLGNVAARAGLDGLHIVRVAPLTAMELRPPAVELAHTDVAAVRQTGDIRTRTTCRPRESPSQWLKE